MKSSYLNWIQRHYSKIIHSIAFYPAIIAVGFLVLSYVLLAIDFSPFGKSIKAQWDFISLKDASTARTIAATIAAGILSLTVFSFSMVMILLNQAASNMSNRVLDSMIGNRFQQWVLGFYIGTIVYALFLLSTIRDIDSGVHVPALSVYLLIFLTVVDIFLFIYFLHYITQSVKYDTIIERIHRQTKNSLEKLCPLREQVESVSFTAPHVQEVTLQASSTLQAVNEKGLLRFCQHNQCQIRFHHPTGTFLLAGTPFLTVYAQQPLSKESLQEVQRLVLFYRGEPVAQNAYYGFKQLREVALKALSPGINDPGTAVLSLQALADLFAFRMEHFPREQEKDQQGAVRVLKKETTFAELFTDTLYPIWDYGKEDRTLRQALHHLLLLLKAKAHPPAQQQCIEHLLQTVKNQERQKDAL
ncbi:DUF2254 domain-containing protein [Rufibacter quisquiliarum]|uniref:Putative membrane protein n=1 Tax=Rufibacter quisquiliarum TaxID=1549639 RepID=A0A839GPU6_9BACT|nr:DUF2254 domain-containing protein [Rufibacter quisquiliarum]MBA9078799.1 putative membrane protein [Rufibacter quisquiliarum]